MNVSIGAPWEAFVEQAVRSGGYASASDVVAEGLRLVEARDAKLRDLRALIDASLAEGGENTDEDVGRALDEIEARLARSGY